MSYESQNFLQQPGHKQASIGMPGQRTACVATQGRNSLIIH